MANADGPVSNVATSKGELTEGQERDCVVGARGHDGSTSISVKDSRRDRPLVLRWADGVGINSKSVRGLPCDSWRRGLLIKSIFEINKALKFY